MTRRPAAPKRATSSKRHTAERRAQDKKGMIFIGISALAVALCVTLAIISRDPPRDPANGCPLSHASPPAHTVILIDQTDRFSHDDLTYARALIRTEYAWLPINGQLTVRNIVSNPDDARDIVVCRMDDGSKVLGIGRNPKKVQKDFQRIAGAQLDKLIENLRAVNPQRNSPILEMISAVFDRPDFGNDIHKRRLILLSDMVQRSDFADHYAGARGYRLSASAREELKRDMSGVAVRIHYVQRRSLKRLQGEAHKAFWLRYMRDLGVTDIALGHGLTMGERAGREVWSEAGEPVAEPKPLVTSTAATSSSAPRAVRRREASAMRRGADAPPPMFDPAPAVAPPPSLATSSGYASEVRNGPRALSPPRWERAPEGDLVAERYPRRALEKGVSGLVRLRCVARGDRGVDCGVISEVPEGYGFGALAELTVRRARLAEQQRDAPLHPGDWLEYAVRFRAPEE